METKIRVSGIRCIWNWRYSSLYGTYPLSFYFWKLSNNGLLSLQRLLLLLVLSSWKQMSCFSKYKVWRIFKSCLTASHRFVCQEDTYWEGCCQHFLINRYIYRPFCSKDGNLNPEQLMTFRYGNFLFVSCAGLLTVVWKTSKLFSDGCMLVSLMT